RPNRTGGPTRLPGSQVAGLRARGLSDLRTDGRGVRARGQPQPLPRKTERAGDGRRRSGHELHAAHRTDRRIGCRTLQAGAQAGWGRAGKASRARSTAHLLTRAVVTALGWAPLGRPPTGGTTLTRAPSEASTSCAIYFSPEASPSRGRWCSAPWSAPKNQRSVCWRASGWGWLCSSASFGTPLRRAWPFHGTPCTG